MSTRPAARAVTDPATKRRPKHRARRAPDSVRAKHGEPTSPGVLLAGLDEELGRRLQSRLGSTAVVRAADVEDEVFSEVEGGSWSVLVVDHASSTLDGPGLMSRMAAARPRGLRLVACLARGAGPEVPGLLVGSLGVDQLLFHPLDPDELARAVARLTGVALPAAEAEEPTATDPMARAVSRIWGRHREQNLERIQVLEEAAMALLEGSMDSELRRSAEREAHKLAGSLGTFGLNAGTTLARRLEIAFGPRLDTVELDPVALSETVEQLRKEVERGPRVAEQDQGEEDAMVVLSCDEKWAESLVVEASRRGLTLIVHQEPGAARQDLLSDAAAGMIVDLSSIPESGLDLVGELAGETPAAPVLVVAESDSLDQRVEVARRGGRGFLPRSASAARIVEAAGNLIARPGAARTTVLAVDDDPQVLDVLEVILRQHGVAVNGLSDPLGFWEALERTAPDALILDEDMPHLTGIELCRVVRADPRWAGLPVLFLTGHRDRDTVRRVFEAGADDFVAKPVVGPELMARLDNRLERTRLHRAMAETDPLTGLANRRKSSQGLQLLLGLAERRNEPVCVAVLDLDHFKNVNDRHGHATGDSVLRRVGQLLKRGLRGEDVIGRWGGEEFVVGLYGANAQQAGDRLRHLMEEFRRESFSTPSGDLSGLTFSVGVAQWPNHGSDLSELYRAADKAMYRAKQSGRSRVMSAGPSSIESADIVVVEDDAMLAGLLVHALEARGHTVQWIDDGQEAARALIGPEATVTPRLVLLDIDLPGLDGVALLRLIIEQGGVGAPRVIMLTVRATEKEMLHSLELGAFDHVAKPVSVPVLMQKVRRALEP